MHDCCHLLGSLVTNASGDVCESVADGAADVIPVAQLKLVPQLFRSEPQLEPPDLTGVAVAEVYGTEAAGFARGVPDRQPAKLVALDDFGAFVINSDLAIWRLAMAPALRPVTRLPLDIVAVPSK